MRITKVFEMFKHSEVLVCLFGFGVCRVASRVGTLLYTGNYLFYVAVVCYIQEFSHRCNGCELNTFS